MANITHGGYFLMGMYLMLPLTSSSSFNKKFRNQYTIMMDIISLLEPRRNLESGPVLRRIAPLAGALVLKTLLLINELTCLLGNVI